MKSNDWGPDHSNLIAIISNTDYMRGLKEQSDFKKNCCAQLRALLKNFSMKSRIASRAQLRGANNRAPNSVLV